MKYFFSCNIIYLIVLHLSSQTAAYKFGIILHWPKMEHFTHRHMHWLMMKHILCLFISCHIFEYCPFIWCRHVQNEWIMQTHTYTHIWLCLILTKDDHVVCMWFFSLSPTASNMNIYINVINEKKNHREENAVYMQNSCYCRFFLSDGSNNMHTAHRTFELGYDMHIYCIPQHVSLSWLEFLDGKAQAGEKCGAIII